MNYIKAVAVLLPIWALTSVLVGCTPPYPTREHTVASRNIIRNPPDPSSVRPGITRRDEVLSAFKEVDTGVSSRWFFWGRWESSSVALGVLTDSGLEQAPLWRVKNFLVEFDDVGRVTKTAMLSDDRAISQLQRILAEHPQPTENAPPVALAGDISLSKKHWCYSKIVMSDSTIEFSTTGHGR